MSEKPRAVANDENSHDDQDLQDGGGELVYRPRVIVGIPDLGLNPYHEMFYRPNLTEHPCTYLEGFPCNVQELRLSVGGDDWDEAYKADSELLRSIETGTMYWIPQTVFVGVACQEAGFGGHPPDGPCLTSGDDSHATGVASSILMENPGALIAYAASDPSIEPFRSSGIPVDIYSVSWAHPVSIPAPAPLSDLCLRHDSAPIYVKSAGNDPYISAAADCWSGDPRNIAVGGGYPANEEMQAQERSNSAKNPDVVSYFCRPGAKGSDVTGEREYCGTSFAGPTVAGGLSKVILGLREASGYTGGLQDSYVDPLLGVTISDLREAMNRTASYEPEGQYPSYEGIPLNPLAPWIQWGWGFYDGLVANATLAYLLGISTAPEKPMEAQAYMEALYAARTVMFEEQR